MIRPALVASTSATCSGDCSTSGRTWRGNERLAGLQLDAGTEVRGLGLRLVVVLPWHSRFLSRPQPGSLRQHANLIDGVPAASRATILPTPGGRPMLSTAPTMQNRDPSSPTRRAQRRHRATRAPSFVAAVSAPQCETSTQTPPEYTTPAPTTAAARLRPRHPRTARWWWPRMGRGWPPPAAAPTPTARSGSKTPPLVRKARAPRASWATAQNSTRRSSRIAPWRGTSRSR